MTAKGAWLGAEAGFLVALAYGFLSLGAYAILSSPGTMLITLPAIYIFAFFVIAVPAILAGAAVGALNGYVLSLFTRRQPELKATFIGLSLPLPFILLLHLLLYQRLPSSQPLSYLLWLFIPSLLLTAISCWTALKLNQSLPLPRWAEVSSRLDDWMIEFILSNRTNLTRYQIDLRLIQAGYSPADIEAVWQAIESSETTFT